MNKKYLFGLALAALLVWFIVDAVSQPSPQDLPGDFEEVGMFRNENNTGPIVRIYSVTVGDTTRWQEMEQYGNLMPYTKYGTTKVYFFAKGQQAPTTLQATPPHFAPTFNRHCLASYEKDVMSKVTFRKHPFR
ncbi:hypothetical protein [Hymenobacter crusticola]|uniref:Uncharacterized protein n=1 Tax=Hymenobacter crusticola TaxID=1770526 RepID=A0A243W9I4_9BACT|nr:hypothetical protein [Hymenobacter crusticola]OUJ72198.1 hypothetical protein BXP70_19655 [Hymenobacter crusticola]